MCPFSSSPLANYTFQQELEKSEELQIAMNNDITDLFFKDLAYRSLNNKNFIIFIEGDTGSGKSTLASSICMRHNNYIQKNISKFVDFNIDNVVFTSGDAVNILKNLPPHSTVQVDEFFIPRVGEGVLRQSEEFRQLSYQIRGELINFLILAPQIMELGVVPHFKIRAIDIDYKRGINRAIVYQKEKHYWNDRAIGHIRIKKTSLEGYDKKKSEWGKKLKEMATKDMSEEYQAIAQKFFEQYIKPYPKPIAKSNWKPLLKQLTKNRYTGDELKDIYARAEILVAEWKLTQENIGLI